MYVFFKKNKFTYTDAKSKLNKPFGSQNKSTSVFEPTRIEYPIQSFRDNKWAFANAKEATKRSFLETANGFDPY